ncbi:alpha/beta fold hydrolase [Sphingomonas sp.]|uniref:alpha/beta fold hydrolase n=1 Tax=Sphingomonas sp. TaxID=28214 RepID=UPI00286DCDE8|nr:alpha/beta fold hydrolase [Sphingomonas sp.]
MGQVDIGGGARLGVEEVGGGPSTPLVFLHGVGSDKSVWWPQLAHFGAERRTVAFDYPGYGDSSPAPPGTTRDDYALAIFAAMDALGIGGAHVCGLSLGGVVAIAMHHAASARCRSLILADSFAVHPDGRGIYERSLAASRGAGMAVLAEQRTPFLLAAETPAAVHDEVRATMARIDPAAFAVGVEAVWLADQRDRVGAIAVPTLVLVGAEDKATPPALSEALAAAIRGARLEVIAAAGHIANLEQPAQFNRLVEAFLDVEGT